MELKVDKQILGTLLDRASGTVSNKDIHPVLKNFLIKAENGKLKVMSTDMSLGAVAQIEVPHIKSEGSVCAPAVKLSEMVDSAPSGQINLKLDSNLLEVRSDYDDKDPANPTFKNEWMLHCMDDALYPEFPEFDAKIAISCPREGLLKGLDRISFAAADNELKINLMAVYINNGHMYAADGHRAARIKYDSKLNDIMIPAPAVTMLVSMLKSSQAPEVKVCKTKFHLLFQVGADLYHTRLLEAQFPDVEGKVFRDTEAYNYKLKLDRKELKDAIKRAQITSEENRKLTLTFKNGKLSLETVNAIEDRCRETLKYAEWNGAPEFERTVNWEFLSDVLTVCTGDKVEIRMGDDKGLQKTKLRIDEGSEFAAIIMPLRINVDAQGKEVKVHDRVKQRVAASEAKKEADSLTT